MRCGCSSIDRVVVKVIIIVIGETNSQKNCLDLDLSLGKKKSGGIAKLACLHFQEQSN